MKRPIRSNHTSRQWGAALITAMLTVTLVATLAAAAVWQQWRAVEVEAAERNRMQMSWILNGALDWARLILREDANTGSAGNVDHLSEPWATPLEEARLSTFLAADKDHTDLDIEAFLSGQISDQQARLNLNNLLEGDHLSEAGMRSFGRLFKVLNLPSEQLLILARNLREASAALPLENTGNIPSTGPSVAARLLPQQVNQLGWLGLPPSTVNALLPYVSVLPVSTSVNLNTAPAQVLYAALPGLEMGEAQRMVNQRASKHYEKVEDAMQASNLSSQTLQALDRQWLSVDSHFFTIKGRLRLGDTTVQEVSLVERQGKEIRVLWRRRDATLANANGSVTSLQ